jgi:hypothetical protein
VFFAGLIEIIFQQNSSELIFPLIGFIAQSKGLGLEMHEDGYGR